MWFLETKASILVTKIIFFLLHYATFFGGGGSGLFLYRDTFLFGCGQTAAYFTHYFEPETHDKPEGFCFSKPVIIR